MKILKHFDYVRAQKVQQKSGANYDLFGLADILGVNATTGEMHFIQVKTNGNHTARQRQLMAQKAFTHLHPQLHNFEIWDRIDRKRWAFYRVNQAEDLAELDMEKYAEIDILNDPAAIAKELLEEREEDYTDRTLKIKRQNPAVRYDPAGVITNKAGE